MSWLSDHRLRKRLTASASDALAAGLLPRQLAIETVNFCNARCVMCPNHELSRPKGVMSPELHRRIVDSVRESGAPIQSISHAGVGEPLVDKHLADRIRYEKAAFPAASVHVYTNGGLLDDVRGAELVDAGVDGVSVSLNAFEAESYERVMNIPHARTMENVHRFVERARAAGHPVRVQVSLTQTEHVSDAEVQRFREYWGARVAAAEVVPLITWGGRFKPGRRRSRPQWPCRYPWEALIVDCDGRVKPCCEDYDTRYCVGDLQVERAGDAFNSEAFRRLRANHLRRCFTDPGMCNGCVESLDVARDFWNQRPVLATRPRQA